LVETRKLVVLDRDGVINEDSDAFIKAPGEWRAIPGSLDAIARLHRAGFEVVVVTNQSGVGRGLFDERMLEAIHARMIEEVEAAGGRIAAIYHCPHRPEEGCECRKPGPGLLRRVEKDFGQRLEGVPMIGDKLADLQAAGAVGARPILVRTGRGEATLDARGTTPTEVYADLASAADALLAEADS
jgi:D-glycero-D-manno-heptose 1,7-bisphosphate phosphatase